MHDSVHSSSAFLTSTERPIGFFFSFTVSKTIIPKGAMMSDKRVGEYVFAAEAKKMRASIR
jgi:hypothetical protein